MKPQEVKQQLRKAVETQDKELAWVCVQEIVNNDLYINVPKPADTDQPKRIITRWGNRPCRAGCGRMISAGTEAWWQPNWGVSHIECLTP